MNILGRLWNRYKAFIMPEGKKNPAQQREFLSAVIELQETPASPTARWFLRGICIFLVLALLWAILGRVDIVATGQGRVIPSGQVKVIQPLETGVVKSILVKEGQAVSASQPLIELDITQTEADETRLRQDLYMTQAHVTRLQGLLDGNVPAFEQNIPESIQTTQANLYSQSLAEQQAQLASLTKQLEQKQFELKGMQASLTRLEKTLPLLTERAQSYQKLAEEELVAKTQALALEEQRLTQVYEHETTKQKVAELQASVAGIRQQIAATKANFRRTLLTELADKSQQADALQQELTKAEQRNKLQILRAPTAGTVQELKTHTIGGVVTPAQELMKIIPQDVELEAEIFLPNKDIGFVSVGQDVQLKLEAFPFTKYGLIHGVIKHISLDAIQDENLGLVYAVRVKLEQPFINVQNKQVNLTPGLALTGEIKTGTRRIIEYFLSPIAMTTSEAIRER